jgi:hypothetical protein
MATGDYWKNMTIKSTYQNITAALRGLCVLESIPALVEESTEARVHEKAALIRNGEHDREARELREKLHNWETWGNGLIDDIGLPVNNGNVFDNTRESIDTIRINQSQLNTAARALNSTLESSLSDWRIWAHDLVRMANLGNAGGDKEMRAAISRYMVNLY